MVPMGGLRDFGVGVIDGQGGVAGPKEGGSLAGKYSVGLEHMKLAYQQVKHKYSLPSSSQNRASSLLPTPWGSWRPHLSLPPQLATLRLREAGTALLLETAFPSYHPGPEAWWPWGHG